MSVKRIKIEESELNYDNSINTSLFGQYWDLLRQYIYSIININRFPLCQFRRSYIHSEDSGQARCFYLNLIGEGVYDSGGPYRELFTLICSKEVIGIYDIYFFIYLDDFHFLIPIPNSNYNLGNNSQSLIFNSSYEDREKYFYFLGILYGICQRDMIRLDVDIHSIIWKYLVNEKIVKKDILEVDNYIDEKNPYIITLYYLFKIDLVY